MVTMRKRTLKVLTLLVLFIFLTSFFLNYSHTMVTTTWFPKQMVVELSENFKKFMKYTHRPCTCARCIGQQRVSAWFDERFNRSMQPLLTAQNALLEEDTYSWWLVRAGAGCGAGAQRGGRAECGEGCTWGPAGRLARFGILECIHSFNNDLSRICYM